jgi:hypothetical protein
VGLEAPEKLLPMLNYSFPFLVKIRNVAF